MPVDAPVMTTVFMPRQYQRVTDKRSALPYRPCVGVILVNEAGRVFLGERKKPRGAWQLPQGGIDEGEEPAAAARRELAEETGVRRATLLARTEGWLRYDLPDELVGKAFKGRYRGQAQLWFAYRLEDEAEIDVHQADAEFAAWRFADLRAVPPLIIAWKRPVYDALIPLFGPVVDGAPPRPGEEIARVGAVRSLWA